MAWFCRRPTDRNAERGDYRVLEGLLGEAIDPYIYHCMGIDVRRSSRRIDLRRPNAPCYSCTRTALARFAGMGPSKSSSPWVDFLLGFARNASTMPTLR